MNLRLALLLSNMYTAETFAKEDADVYCVRVSVEERECRPMLPLEKPGKQEVFMYVVDGRKSPLENFSIESAEKYLESCGLSLSGWTPVKREATGA